MDDANLVARVREDLVQWKGRVGHYNRACRDMHTLRSNGMSMSALSRELDLSRQRVSQMADKGYKLKLEDGA